jgi:hypothetical protein
MAVQYRYGKAKIGSDFNVTQNTSRAIGQIGDGAFWSPEKRNTLFMANGFMRMKP